jgi:four helix bundle protein
MASFRRFEDIEAWQVARRLNQKIWALVSTGAFGRDFALSDQINRAAGSAMDNIAEGFDSGTDAEFARFLRYSQRSCAEVKSQLYRARDREHVTSDDVAEISALIEEVSRKVGSLIRFLSRS